MSEYREYMIGQKRNSFTIADAKLMFGQAFVFAQLAALVVGFFVQDDIVMSLAMQIMFFMLIVIHTKKNGINIERAARIKPTKPINYVLAFIIAPLAMMFMMPLLGLWQTMLENLGMDLSIFASTSYESLGLQIISTLVIAGGPMLGEELLFRGVIANAYAQKHSVIKSILIAAVFFTVMHANPVQFLHPFVIGCIIGFVMFKTDSLFTAMIIHFTNNFIACVMDYWLSDEANMFLMENQWLLMAVCGVLLVVVLGVMYFINKENAPRFGKNAKTHVDSNDPEEEQEISLEEMEILHSGIPSYNEVILARQAENAVRRKNTTANAWMIVALVICGLSFFTFFIM